MKTVMEEKTSKTWAPPQTHKRSQLTKRFKKGQK
jgi:hypothetical protein